MIQKDKNVPGFIASVGSAPFARLEEPATDAAALHAEPARLRGLMCTSDLPAIGL